MNKTKQKFQFLREVLNKIFKRIFKRISNKTKQKFQKETHINSDTTFTFISYYLLAVRRSRCNEMNVGTEQRGTAFDSCGGRSSSDEQMIEEGRKHGEPRVQAGSLTKSGKPYRAGI